MNNQDDNSEGTVKENRKIEQKDQGSEKIIKETDKSQSTKDVGISIQDDNSVKENSKNAQKDLNPEKIVKEADESQSTKDAGEPITKAEVKGIQTLNNLFDRIFSMMENMTNQLIKEDNVRKNFCNYFFVFLYLITFIPLLISVILFIIKGGDFGVGVIAALISIPVNILTIFQVIAKRLFDDPYRKSLPDMISKVVDSTGKLMIDK